MENLNPENNDSTNTTTSTEAANDPQSPLAQSKWRILKRYLKLLLKLLKLLFILLILYLLFQFARYKIAQHNQNNAFNSAFNKCGKNPVVRIYKDGWKTDKYEILTDVNPDYEKYKKSVAGGGLLSIEVVGYYCSIEEAKVAAEEKSNEYYQDDLQSNYDQNYRDELAKMVLQSYSKQFKMTPYELGIVPKSIMYEKIEVFRYTVSDSDNKPLPSAYPYEITYVSSNNNVKGKSVIIKCDIYDDVGELYFANNLTSEVLEKFNSSGKYSNLEYISNDTSQIWLTQHIRGIDDITHCYLIDEHKLLTKDEGTTAIKNIKKINISKLSNVRIY